jgi:hypothetical protein
MTAVLDRPAPVLPACLEAVKEAAMAAGITAESPELDEEAEQLARQERQD